MRRAGQAIAFLTACGTLAACAAISGLDQIQESQCAPNGCNDASTQGDTQFGTSPDVQAVAVDDAGNQGLPDVAEDQGSEDAELAQDSGEETSEATDATEPAEAAATPLATRPTLPR